MTANRNKLELAMATACMNPYDLCKLVDIQYQTFRRIINGGNAKTATIGKIARALNVDVTEIIHNTAATVNNQIETNQG